MNDEIRNKEVNLQDTTSKLTSLSRRKEVVEEEYGSLQRQNEVIKEELDALKHKLMKKEELLEEKNKWVGGGGGLVEGG